MYDVAASIVTYNCNLEKLQSAIDSLLAQPVQTHLTIVDNNSKPDYVQRLKQLAGSQVIESGYNGGYGFGHNLAMKEAPPHRYYLVMNPDVSIHDNALKSMVDYMDENPEIALLVPRVLYPNNYLQPLNKRLPNVLDFFVRRFMPRPIRKLSYFEKRQQRYEMRDIGYSTSYQVPFPSGCFMLFRAEILAKVGGFDERYFMYLEDCDIGRRTAEYGKIIYYPHASITHHWTRGAHHSWRLTYQFIRSMVLYFNKWGWKWR